MLSALSHFLLPRERNNHRAHILHPFSLSLFVVAFVGLEILAYSFPGFIPSVIGAIDNITPKSIIEITNQKRTDGGLPRFNENTVLDRAAEDKAADMISRDYWAHNAPDGTTPWHFFKEEGYPYQYAGENLARDFTKPEDVVDAWIASPSHKENLFSPRYEEIGVAVVSGMLKGHNTTLVVQFFGTKLGTTVPGIVKKTANSSYGSLNSLIEGKSVQAASSFASLFNVTRSLGIFLLSLFIIVLVIDLVVIHAKGINRHASRSGGHILFLATILFIVLILKGGKIF